MMRMRSKLFAGVLEHHAGTSTLEIALACKRPVDLETSEIAAADAWCRVQARRDCRFSICRPAINAAREQMA